MPIKNLIHRFQPAQLYIVLVLSICYFSVQLVLSHITHALTLLMASYHMLCNIFALTGCIITIKRSKLNYKSDSKDSSTTQISGNYDGTPIEDFQKPNIDFSCNIEAQSLAKRERREIKLRNTFGWTRIDILTMLIVCIILASLSFSLLVEALQTLVHIDHQDTMHLPIPVMILGFAGLILNGITYLLIGGYTMHQGSFLHVTPDGDVVLNRAMSPSGDLTLKADERQLSKTANNQIMKMEEDLKSGDPSNGKVHYQPKRQGSVEIFRDLSSTIFVIVCALIVYIAQDQEHTAKFIDPVLSIFSCVLLVTLSYPYMKESCLILLQTIPGSIDMEIFERQLVTKFPEIISYHDLHIWQLSAHKYVSTVHIKFQNPKLYLKIIDDVRSFFREQGITIITIQPEFHCAKSTPSLECLVQCQAPECAEKVCCKDSRSDLREIVSVCPSGTETTSQHDKQNGHGHSHNHNHSHHNHENGDSHTTKSKGGLELKISSLLKLKNVLKRSQSTSQLGNSVVEKQCNTGGVLQKTSSEWQVPGMTTAEATTPSVVTNTTKIVTSTLNLPSVTRIDDSGVPTEVPVEQKTTAVKE